MLRRIAMAFVILDCVEIKVLKENQRHISSIQGLLSSYDHGFAEASSDSLFLGPTSGY